MKVNNWTTRKVVQVIGWLIDSFASVFTEINATNPAMYGKNVFPKIGAKPLHNQK